MKFCIMGATDTGTSRPTNQDSMFAKRFMTGWGECAFAVLCDGMGGLQHGEIASASITAAFADWAGKRLTAAEAPISDHALRLEWTEIIRSENQKLQAYGVEHHCHLGSTVTALLVSAQRYYVLNIGDSRAYELYDTCRQLTVDHTVAENEVHLGNLTQEQAQMLPMKNVLTRCVGVYDCVYPDLFFGDTKPGAVYMLCSDGFRHHVTREELLAYLMPRSGDPAEGLRKGEAALIDLDKRRGERDNISVLAVYAGPQGTE